MFFFKQAAPFQTHMLDLEEASVPSRHTTLKQRHIDVDATRRIDVGMTLF